MPKNVRCSFCGKDFSQGNGIIYIKRDGSLLHFCSSKCRKSNLYLRRDSR